MALVQTARPGVATAFAEVARAPSAPPDAAWAHPDEALWATAYGAAEVREGTSLRSVLSGLDAPAGLPRRLPGPWFGAASFDGAMGPEWSGFAPLRFTLPALLAWRDGGRHLLAAFGDGAQARLDAARAALDRASRPAKPPRAGVRVIHQAGQRAKWNELVERALAAIRAGTLDKVVLARAIDVESDAPLRPEALLAALEARYPSCRAFLVRGASGVFLGATPEILCRVDGDRVQADALAGSAAPDQTEQLSRSAKDLREHRWVVEHITRALKEVAEHVEWPSEPRVRALANVAHLYTPVVARLGRGRGIAEVAAALHPTPAVGGVPSAAALRFLAEHEALDRGLYAGLVGWVGDGRAELAVALRSALIRGRRARLFVGSGIVEGSSPESEWEETEMKARALLDALGARP